MPPERRLAAIMFTDIVGYTALMGSDEKKTFELLHRNRKLQKLTIEKYKGKLLKVMGDGILASFNSSSDAVRCAGEIQNRGTNEDIRLRIGIHAGEVVFEGSDVLGDGVNVASRLEKLADAGSIYISGSVYKDIKNKEGIRIEFIEEKTLKNVDEPIKVYKVYCEETEEEEKFDFFPTNDTEISIAVLPFLNMSNDPEQEYLCDGISEEIINALSQIENLKVIARTSAFMFKARQEDIREIGRKLNVRKLLEGSVRKAGSNIRISVQLINVSDGFHLWSESFNRELKDIFTIQEEISLAVVNNLKIKLFGKEKEMILNRGTENLEAYDLYLKGFYYRQLLTAEGCNKAILSFEQSIQKDPNFANPYLGLSIVYMDMSLWGNLQPKEAYPIAKKYVKKAIKIDYNIADAHISLGHINMIYDWNWNLAEKELKLALKLNPNSSPAHLAYSQFLTFTNNHDEAIKEVREAQRLDPLSIYINSSVGQTYLYAGQYDKAIEVQKIILETNPNYFPAHVNLAHAYAGKSMLNEATKEVKKAVNLSGRAPVVISALANGYLEIGKKEMAEKLIDDLLKKRKNEYVPATCFLHYYMLRDDLDKAYTWLKRAIHEHDSLLPLWIINPIDKYAIPNEPRFNALLNIVGMERNINLGW